MRLAPLLFLSFALACRREPSATRQPAASASAQASPKLEASAQRLLAAEHDRNPAAIPDAALSDRDPRSRSFAVRALARMGDERARERLLSALADDDPSAVEWAAFGLGHVCKGAEDSVARALSVRAAGLLARSQDSSVAAVSAIARALGRCASDEAERTLRGWLALEPALADQAAIALGVAGMRRGSLDTASYARLLDAAADSKQPLASALFAFGRSSVPEGPLRTRLIEVATRNLSGGERTRRFALRALGRSGTGAVAPLRAVAERAETPAAERAEAVRELARIDGADAQHALSELLPALIALSGGNFTAPDQGAELGALVTLLDALTSTRARPALERLARLDLPGADPARRHAVIIRCAAARVLADRSSLQPDLVACDPDPNGRIGKLALLRVLDRGELTGERARRHESLTRDADPVVRKSALELLSKHREANQVVPMLTRALSDPAPGPLAVAAELLAEHPDRAQAAPEGREPRTDPRLVELLATSFRLQQKTPNLELRSALIDAAGALGVLVLKPDIARDCASDNPTLRSHAERALRAFGEQNLRCERGNDPALPPEELARLVPQSIQRLAFETDAGPLVLDLDPGLAPVAVTRMVELANSGFFDGISVHRVVPGFVVQFGDPGGDGYGGVERRALRSELGPGAFEPGSVGIALSGPDTGSSQLFVTLGSYPHLDGEYSRIGTAGPGWERLVLGDRIQRVRPVKR